MRRTKTLCFTEKTKAIRRFSRGFMRSAPSRRKEKKLTLMDRTRKNITVGRIASWILKRRSFGPQTRG